MRQASQTVFAAATAKNNLTIVTLLYMRWQGQGKTGQVEQLDVAPEAEHRLNRQNIGLENWPHVGCVHGFCLRWETGQFVSLKE